MSSCQFHILFSGCVQGVGFRFTVKDIAQQYGLAGWVKNLPDGRVESLIQSSEEQWNDFLNELKIRFDIQDIIVQKENISQKLSSFTIAY